MLVGRKVYIPKVYVYTITVYNMIITENERKVLKLLFSAFKEVYSINRIARECNLAPNGALKILRKFETEGILKSEKINNFKSYRLDFENEKTKNILKLALIPEIKGRLKFRADDLKQLRDTAEVCIIFGSYTNLGKEPNDIDVFFIIESKKFKDFKKEASLIYKTIPIKVHDVLQTEEDAAENLKKGNKVIREIFKTGIILWGYDKMMEIAEHEYKR